MDKKILIDLGLTEEIADKVLEAVKAETGKLTEEKTAAEIKASTLETQLGEAVGKLKEFEDMDIDGIKQSAKNLQDKYDKETKDLQAKLDAQAYDFAAERYLSKYKFTSEAARKGVAGEFKGKGFKLEDGKLLGADEYMKSVMEANPAAFESEKDKSVPNLMTGSGGVSGAASIDAARAIMGLKTDK